MTVRDIVQSIGRRWYVFVLIAAAIAALAASMYLDGGSYATKTTVTFRAPEVTSALSSATTTDAGVIAFAGAVAAEINQGRPVQTYASSDAPYYGAGVREGVLVSLRSSGSQWAASYPSATIDIQIVGRTREWVEEQQQGILDDILSVTAAQQESIVTAPSARISVDIDPLSMQIVSIGSTHTTQILAGIAMLVVTLLVGGGMSVVVDQWARRVVRHRARVPRARRLLGRLHV